MLQHLAYYDFTIVEVTERPSKVNNRWPNVHIVFRAPEGSTIVKVFSLSAPAYWMRFLIKMGRKRAHENVNPKYLIGKVARLKAKQVEYNGNKYWDVEV